MINMYLGKYSYVPIRRIDLNKRGGRHFHYIQRGLALRHYYVLKCPFIRDLRAKKSMHIAIGIRKYKQRFCDYTKQKSTCQNLTEMQISHSGDPLTNVQKGFVIIQGKCMKNHCKCRFCMLYQFGTKQALTHNVLYFTF